MTWPLGGGFRQQKIFFLTVNFLKAPIQFTCKGSPSTFVSMIKIPENLTFAWLLRTFAFHFLTFCSWSKVRDDHPPYHPLCPPPSPQFILVNWRSTFEVCLVYSDRWSTEVNGGQRRSSEVIGGHRRSSEVDSGHWRLLEVGWDGMVVIGHKSSKGTFGARN